METRCYYIHALTALHMGTGQGTGVIDLPIAREKSTGLPLVPGSGVKGVLRDTFRPEEGNGSEEKNRWEVLFGPESKDLKNDDAFAGALNIQDAQLLCLPVRSVYGVFAWVTCPFVLDRYRRDLFLVQGYNLPRLTAPLIDGNVLITPSCKLKSSLKPGKVFLEDLDLTVLDSDKSKTITDKIAEKIAEYIFPIEADVHWRTALRERFIITSDNVFSFLAETSMEIRARIKIKEETRTVDRGALWYEENLPAETLLWGILGCDRSRAKKKHKKNGLELFSEFSTEVIKGCETNLQIGGNATVGRGNIRWILSLQNDGE